MVFVNFGDKVTKIRKYNVIFVYIFQGKMGKMEKNATKVTKIPKLKGEKYGMNKTDDTYHRLRTPKESFFSNIPNVLADQPN